MIGLMVDKAKKAGITTIFNIMDQVFPLITTSVSKTELLNMVPSLIGYNIADTTGFPSKYKFADVKNASMVVADTLEENVKELHAFLYGADESYEPSQNIIEANDKIIELVGGADTLVDEAPAVTSDDTSSDVVWQGDGSGNTIIMITAATIAMITVIMIIVMMALKTEANIKRKDILK